MLKSFKELYELDLKKYVQKKPTFKKENGKYTKLPEKYWLDYLEWATVFFLLYDNGANSVSYDVVNNQDGYPCFYNTNNDNPFVRIIVNIDGKKYEMLYPVIDGNKVSNNPDQLIIHKAHQRAFVKAVAINTGLGLKLWQKEEQKFDQLIDDKQSKTIKKKPFPKEKFSETVKWLKNGGTIEKIRKYYEINEETESKLFEEAL